MPERYVSGLNDLNENSVLHGHLPYQPADTHHLG